MQMNSFKKWDWGIQLRRVYQFTFDKSDSNDTNIIQYFSMHGL